MYSINEIRKEFLKVRRKSRKSDRQKGKTEEIEKDRKDRNEQKLKNKNSMMSSSYWQNTFNFAR
jgi:hypothetical protein